MKRIGVIAKLHHGEAAPVLKELCDWLRARDREVVMDASTAGILGEESSHRKADIPKLVDLIVVLGGDGTLLSVARLLVDFEVPLLGINLGSLGFLTEVTRDEMIGVLEKVLAGDVRIEKRLLLKTDVLRQGERVASSSCLNDVVVSKGTLARMIRLHILVLAVMILLHQHRAVYRACSLLTAVAQYGRKRQTFIQNIVHHQHGASRQRL